MVRRDLVVIGGSAGGLAGLLTFLSALPQGLPAGIVAVLHRPSDAAGNLAMVLNRASRLPVQPAVDGAPIVAGRVYIAPPGQHTLIRHDHLVLAHSARVNRVRPAVDPLFRSAARWYGPSAIGIVFSGALDDGSVGLAALAERGAVCLVQDPDEALFPGMPRSALGLVPSAKALPASEMAQLVTDLCGQEVPESEAPLDADLVLETDLAERDERGMQRRRPGSPVEVSCPECRGAMTVVTTGGAEHYRCHVGHSYAPQSLLAAQLDSAESALWSAVAILEEQQALHRTLAERGSELRREHHRRSGRQAARAAEAVRAMIHTMLEVAETEPAAPASTSDS
jgi:two-component system chemotaxis response regulator CheB